MTLYTVLSAHTLLILLLRHPLINKQQVATHRARFCSDVSNGQIRVSGQAFPITEHHRIWMKFNGNLTVCSRLLPGELEFLGCGKNNCSLTSFTEISAIPAI